MAAVNPFSAQFIPGKPKGVNPFSDKFIVPGLEGIQITPQARTSQPTEIDPSQVGVLGSFGRGLSRGVSNIRTTGLELTALASMGVGSEETQRQLIQDLQDRNRMLAEEKPDVVPFENAFDNPSNFVKWVAFNLGEQVPNVATIIASGGIGGLVGKMVIKKAISKVTADAAIRYGQLLGAAAGASAIEIGATVGEQAEATGKINAKVALSAGVAKGMLEAIAPVGIGRAAGILRAPEKQVFKVISNALDDSRGIFTRAGSSFLKTGVVEAGTEALQETIDVVARSYVDKNYPLYSKESKDRLVKSAVTAFFTGGPFGAATTFVAGRRGFEGEENLAPAIVGEGDVADDIGPILALPPPTSPTQPPVKTTPSGPPIRLPGPTSVVTPSPPPIEDVVDNAGSTPVALVPKDVSSKYVEVHKNIDDATLASTAVGRKGAASESTLIAVDPESITDKTATLADLKRAFSKSIKGITAPSVAVAKLGIRAAEAYELNLPVYHEKNAKAVALYQRAIEEGFRYKPKEGGAFVPVGEITGTEVSHRSMVEVMKDFRGVMEPLKASKATTSLSNKPELYPEVVRLSDLPPKSYYSSATGLEGFYTISELKETLADAIKNGKLFLARGLTIDGVANILRKHRSGIAKATDRLEIPEYLPDYLRDGGFLPRAEGFIQADEKIVKRFKTKSPFGSPAIKPSGSFSIEEMVQSMELSASVADRALRLLRNLDVPFGFVFESKELETRMRKEGKRLIKLTREFLTALVGEFAPNTNTVVYFTTSDSRHGANASSVDKDGNRFQIIEIAINDGVLRQLKNPEGKASLILLLAHEFAHSLSTFYLHNKNVPAAIYEGLMSAYYRALYRRKLVMDPELTAGDFRSLGTMLNHRIDPDALFEAEHRSVEFNKPYLLKFEEWFAREMEKWITRDVKRPPLGRVEKFIAGIASLVNKVFESASKFNRRFLDEQYSPSQAFKDFVEYIHSKGNDQIKNTESAVKGHLQPDHFDPSLGVNFSLGSPFSRVGRSIVDEVRRRRRLPRDVEEGIVRAANASDYFNNLVKWGFNVFQLAKKNPHISHLQDYLAKLDLWKIEKSFWQSKANDTVRQWASLGKDNSEALAKLLFDLDKQVYLRPGEDSRTPTQAELQALFDRHRINAGTKLVYDQIKSDFDTFLQRSQDLLEDGVRRRFTDKPALRARRLLEIRKSFQELRKVPYFPHSRFGEFAVIVKEGERTVYMEQVEGSKFVAGLGKTPRSVRKVARGIKSRFKAEDGYKVSIDRIPEDSQIFAGFPVQLLQEIKDVLGDSLSVDQKVWLDTLMIQHSPAQSFRKHFLKRENIPGYTQDAMRAFANYFWHGANHMARVSYGTEMQEVIKGFKEDNKLLRRQGVDLAKRTQMVGFLEQHLEGVLNPKPDWAQLRSVAFIMWLGYVPASAVLNLTQLPLATAPYLTKHFGTASGLAAMTKAATKFRRMYQNPANIRNDTDASLLKMIELGIQQGFLEESLAMELAGVAEGNSLSRTRHGTSLQRGLSTLASTAGWMFQASEKINRRISFNAAVALVREAPDSRFVVDLKNNNLELYRSLRTTHGLSDIDAKAFIVGKDVVRTTQFEYGREARPRFMQGRKGVIFTFYMYLQGMLFNVAYNPARLRMIFTMMAMAGLTGLPGADDLMSIVSFAATKMLGSRFDAEEEIAKVLTELFGDNRTADLILHGAAREGFGLPAAGDIVGIPVPHFDMSGAVQLGTVVPGLKEILSSTQGNFEESLGRATTDIAGASLGIGLNLWKFLTDTSLPIHDAKRWERALPRALKNISKASRFVPPDADVAVLTGNFVAPEGRERSRGGDTIIAFDADNPEHMMEIAMQAMGFTPTRLSREWNLRIAEAEAVNYWKLRRGILLNNFWHTIYTKDPEARKDVIKAIRAFNKLAPVPGLRITGDTLRSSVERRAKIKAMKEAGLNPIKMFRGVSQQVQEIIPGGTSVISREVVK